MSHSSAAVVPRAPAATCVGAGQDEVVDRPQARVGLPGAGQEQQDEDRGDHARSASRARSRSATSAGSVTLARTRERDVEHRPHPRGARGEDHDAVGEHRGLLDVVRDEERRARRAGQRGGQPVAHVGAGERVERAERLVEAEDGLAAEQRAQERDALAHPAGELVGPGVLEAAEAERRRTAAAPAARALARSAPWMRSASAALSSASSHGSSRSRWGMSTAGAASTPPAVGATAGRRRARGRVVLPQPDGPTSATISRSRTSSVTPASASSGATVPPARGVGERGLAQAHARRGGLPRR